MAFEEKIRLAVDRAAANFFKTKLEKKARLIGDEIINFIQLRTDNGKDKFARSFKKRSPEYLGYKSKVLRGKAKKPKGFRRTEFSADSASDWLRSSGRLFSGMKYSIKVNRPKVFSNKGGSIIITIFIENRLEGQAKGLLKLRKFWGFPSNKKLPKLLTNRINKILA